MKAITDRGGKEPMEIAQEKEKTIQGGQDERSSI